MRRAYIDCTVLVTAGNRRAPGRGGAHRVTAYTGGSIIQLDFTVVYYYCQDYLPA